MSFIWLFFKFKFVLNIINNIDSYCLIEIEFTVCILSTVTEKRNTKLNKTITIHKSEIHYCNANGSIDRRYIVARMVYENNESKTTLNFILIVFGERPNVCK